MSRIRKLFRLQRQTEDCKPDGEEEGKIWKMLVSRTTLHLVLFLLNLVFCVAVCGLAGNWLALELQDLHWRLPREVKMGEDIKHDGDICMTFLKTSAAEVKIKMDHSLGLFALYCSLEILSLGLLWKALQGNLQWGDCWGGLQSAVLLVLFAFGFHKFLRIVLFSSHLDKERKWAKTWKMAAISYVVFVGWKLCLLYYVNRKRMKAPPREAPPTSLAGSLGEGGKKVRYIHIPVARRTEKVVVTELKETEVDPEDNMVVKHSLGFGQLEALDVIYFLLRHLRFSSRHCLTLPFLRGLWDSRATLIELSERAGGGSAGSQKKKKENGGLKVTFEDQVNSAAPTKDVADKDVNGDLWGYVSYERKQAPTQDRP